MYRTRHFRWKMMHISVLLAHLGLIVAAGISYLYEIDAGTSSIRRRPHQLVVSEMMHPCTLSRAGMFVDGLTSDVASRTLIMACLVVGTIGLVLNISLFALLLILEPNRITLTEGERHWRKQTATFFGCLLNLLLAGAGVGLAIALGTRARDTGAMRLIPPLMWVSMQVALVISTAIFDAVKNYREGQDLLD
ncbi:hypothetical protein N658DRAFT_38219 [Parathielavia hyrcaniae]|uniref:Uncharacterized protein n=1 Tax=Parathielavia hyrcaniae TaxID=113614 RepID=A0AAN6Q1C2_9PEZI|nr:hypothetical protein N658DRAFT_38219 [Parathielavia hyrcaniae]